MITLKVRLTCKLHPSYTGVRPPRSTKCNCCEAIYTARHDPKQFAFEAFGSNDTKATVEVIDERNAVLGNLGR